MKLRTAWLSICAILVCTSIFGGCASNGTGSGPTLTIKDLGTGNGKVTDNLSEASCVDGSGVVTGTCSPKYTSGTMVTLTAAVTAPSTFAGWGGTCASSGTAITCTVTVSSSQTVTADFVPPPAMQNVTFPTGTNPPAQQATFNCPSNTNPCTDPNAHSLQLQIPQVGTGFTVTVMAVEVPPGQGIGLCKAGNTVLNDFDCRFATFFNYGTDGQGNITVPLCYPYANGNCIHYEVFSGTPGTEPDPSLYSGGVNWQIAWNDDAYVPPAPYTGNQPRLYDDPDYAPTPTSAVGSLCTQPMTINGVNQSYTCQFEFDITTSFNASQPVDSVIGGKTKQLNDVVVGFPPTIAGAGQLSASTTPDSTTVPPGSPIGFTINVSNAGPGTDNTVTLSDPLPSGVGVTWSISPAYSGPGTCSITGATGSQVLSCGFGNLAAGTNATLHVSSATAPAGTYTNAATITVNNQQYLTLTTITVSASAEGIAFTPALPASAVTGSAVSVNATVSNDTGNGGVNWTVTCGSAACGSFTAAHTASGVSTTYNASANVPTGNAVTITATAVDAPSPQVSSAVTITPPGIQVTFSPTPNPNLVTDGTALLTADVANDGTNAGVDWSVTCASAQCGSFTTTPAHTASGVQIGYVAPPSIPTGQTVTITAKSTANPAQLAQATIWITNIATGNCLGAPTGDESMLSGHYAFFAQGFSGSGTGSPHAYAGSVAFDGHGNIVDLGGGIGGEVDLNDASQTPSYTHFTVNVIGSSYTVGLDPTGSGNLACVVVSTSNGPATFATALNAVYPTVSSKGRIIKFDDTTGTGSRSSGIIRLQDPTVFSTGDTTKLMSNYAFGLDGVDFAGGHFASAGSFALNPSTGAMSNIVSDSDDEGTLSAATPGETGSITSVSSTTGRALVQVTNGGNMTNYAIYIVSANEFFVIQTDPFTGGSSAFPIGSGRVFATASSFSQSSLSGNYIIHVTGISGGNADVNIGLLTLSGGTVNGTLYEYAAGSPQPPDTISGSYLVSSPSGRVTITQSAGNNPPVLYLVAPAVDGISAFIVGTDSTAIFGAAEASSGMFTTSSLAGNYFFGTEDPGDNTVTDQDGVVTIASSGSCNGTQNNSGQSGLSTGAISGCAFTITNSNGTGNAGGTNSVAITNGTKIFFYDEGGSQTNPAQIRVVERQ